MKTLDQIRKEWENPTHSDVWLVVPKVIDGYTSVLVIVKNRNRASYALHRYFSIMENWDVSVDVKDGSLKACLDEVTKQMKELYPK